MIAGVGVLGAVLLFNISASLQRTATEVKALSEQVANLEASIGQVRADLERVQAQASAVGDGIGAQVEPQEMAARVWRLIQSQNYAFSWHYEPGTATDFYEGQPPHGAVLRTFTNAVAYDAVQAEVGVFPPGSVIVKENRTAERDLDSVTVMVKVPGFNPEANDWFWAKYGADGTVQAAGKVEGCIGCHSQAKDNDFVFNATVNPQAQR